MIHAAASDKENRSLTKAVWERPATFRSAAAGAPLAPCVRGVYAILSPVSRQRMSATNNRQEPSRHPHASIGLKRRRKRNPGYWFGVLNDAVRADRLRGEPRDLSEDDILGWADAFYARHGDWPSFDSGPIPESCGETWLTVSAALALGLRGLPLVDRFRVSSPAIGVDTTGQSRNSH